MAQQEIAYPLLSGTEKLMPFVRITPGIADRAGRCGLVRCPDGAHESLITSFCTGVLKRNHGPDGGGQPSDDGDLQYQTEDAREQLAPQQK